MKLVNLLVALLGGIALLLSVNHTYASNYGDGDYNDDVYNGSSTTPTPTLVPTNTPTPTNLPNNNTSQSSHNNNSGGSSSSDNSCHDTPPSSAPHLYQIDRKGTTATLFFSPAGNPYNKYLIVFGYAENDERFSAEINVSNAKGALSYTVNQLNPGSTYYFKVRGAYGCASGAWSGSIATTGVSKNNTKKISFYPQKQTITSRIYNTLRNTQYAVLAPKPALTVPPQTPQRKVTPQKTSEEKVITQQSAARPVTTAPGPKSLLQDIIRSLKFW